MRRKPASIIMSSLLVVSALALAFNVQPVKSDYVWTETIYIQADGSIQPSTAPISNFDNVTYTLTDNITGNVPDFSSAIIMQRDNIIVDGAGHTLQGTQVQYSLGIELMGRNNITIKNMKITAYTYGIALYSSSSNNSVTGNNITANNNGIHLVSSSNNSIAGNNITANNEYGIAFYSSNNNSVSGNNITNNWYGIMLYSSSNNTFYHNNFMNNTSQVYSYNSTNVWDNGAPEALPIYLITLAGLAIIIAVGAVAFIVRRKKKPPEEAKSPQISARAKKLK